MTAPEWRPVPGFEEKYEVSSSGFLRRLDDGRVIGAAADGYRWLTLRLRGRKLHASLHQIVALVFLGERQTGVVVDHIDGDKTNNAAANLEYVTPKENTHRAMRSGAFYVSRRSRLAAALGVDAAELLAEDDA